MSGVKGVMMDMYKDIVSVEANKVRTALQIQALFTRKDTEIWTEIRPVKVSHCVNGDGPKFGQNGCGTHLSWISPRISVTPYVAVQPKIGVGVVTCEQGLSNDKTDTK